MIQQVYSFLPKEEMKIYALIKLQIHAYNTFLHTVQNLGTLKMPFFSGGMAGETVVSHTKEYYSALKIKDLPTMKRNDRTLNECY